VARRHPVEHREQEILSVAGAAIELIGHFHRPAAGIALSYHNGTAEGKDFHIDRSGG
jgi:hypothetical protein